MINGKKENLRFFESEEEVESYFQHYNNLEERALTDHTEISSPLKKVKSFNENGWWSKDSGCLAVTTKDGKIVGSIIFSRKTEMELSIGYRLLKTKDRNNGYMGEALGLFSKYLFETIPLFTRLTIFTPEDNTPSRKMAEKCGYKLEGILRNAYFYRGKICNWTLYSLLREECLTNN